MTNDPKTALPTSLPTDVSPASEPDPGGDNQPVFDFATLFSRLFALLLAGSLTVTAIVAESIPLLHFLAGPGSGWAASRLFAWCRDNAQLQQFAGDRRTKGRRAEDSYLVDLGRYVVSFLFFDSATAALVVMVMGLIVSSSAAAALSWASGVPISEVSTNLGAILWTQAAYLFKTGYQPRTPGGVQSWRLPVVPVPVECQSNLDCAVRRASGETRCTTCPER